MRLRVRKLESGENDQELFLGVIFVPAALLSAAAAVILPGRWVPPCTFHRIVGLPCPTCGAYRCVEALLHGQIPQAIVMQPLLFLALAAAVLYSLYAVIVVSFHLPRIRLEGITRANRWTLAVIIILLIITNWLYLIQNGR